MSDHLTTRQRAARNSHRRGWRDAPGFSFYWTGEAPLHHACHASQLQDEVKRLDFDLDCAKADAKNARYLLGDARAEVERLRSELTRRCGVVYAPGSIDF